MSTGLLGFETVQERQGGVWEYISPSRLNCWLSCPLKWKLRYIEGIRTPTTPSLFTGKAVHAGLECYYRHRQLGVTLEADDVARRMLESWAALVDEEEMDFDSSKAETAMRQQVADLVRAYLDYMCPRTRSRWPSRWPPKCRSSIPRPAKTSASLWSASSTWCSTAMPARSSRTSRRRHVAASRWKSRNEIQLSSYAWLYRQIAGQQEGGLEIRSLIKTKPAKCEFHPYPARTDAHFRRLFAVIREYLGCHRRRQVQLPARLRLRDVRLSQGVSSLGWNVVIT